MVKKYIEAMLLDRSTIDVCRRRVTVNLAWGCFLNSKRLAEILGQVENLIHCRENSKSGTDTEYGLIQILTSFPK